MNEMKTKQIGGVDIENVSISLLKAKPFRRES